MELGDWVGADIELAIHARLADELRDPLHLWYVPLYQAQPRDARRAAWPTPSGSPARRSRPAAASQAQNAAQLYAVQLFALRMMQGRLSEVEQSLEEFAPPLPGGAGVARGGGVRAARSSGAPSTRGARSRR